MPRLLSLLLLSLLSFAGCGEEIDLTPRGVDAEVDAVEAEVCEGLPQDPDHPPGWPFSPSLFETDIYPLLESDCVDCHAAPQRVGRYAVWPEAAPGSCDWQRSLAAFAAKVDLRAPESSPLYVELSGGNPAHPLTLERPDLLRILAFVQDAAERMDAPPDAGLPPDAGPQDMGVEEGDAQTPPADVGPEVDGGPDPDVRVPDPDVGPEPGGPLDFAAFVEVVQPLLDAQGCATCHTPSRGAGGFSLFPNPNAETVQVNHAQVVQRCVAGDPQASVFYDFAGNFHEGSRAFAPLNLQAIADWINGT